jgi:hypothetical protein
LIDTEVTERVKERETEREREKERKKEKKKDFEPQPPSDPSVGLFCHPCITTTHVSYSLLVSYL